MSTPPGPEVASSSGAADASVAHPFVPETTPFNSLTDSISADPWVKALFALSHAAAKKQSPRRSRPWVPQAEVAATQGAAEFSYSLAESAPQLANPLAPLRDRDRQALGAIFAHDHMAAIEADILTRLSYLVPEPIWEVEPYEFLREFL